MKRFVICFGALMLAAPASAADWEEIGGNDSGTVFFVDRSSIRAVGNKMQVWVMFDYSKNRTKKERSTKELWKFDCNNQKSFTASWTNYSPDGTAIKSDAPMEYEFKYEPVVPGTFGETAMNVACAS